eukprot:1158918-Pelagomonas_calceolata.AAC.10
MSTWSTKDRTEDLRRQRELDFLHQLRKRGHIENTTLNYMLALTAPVQVEVTAEEGKQTCKHSVRRAMQGRTLSC